MNLTSYILEQALRRLQLPESSIKQFQLAGKFSDVEGRGFPKELFLLSTPVIIRGLLNFAVLQMQRDWLYPYWANKQLDPKSASYIPRAQNPLLINVTHRNWTMVGTLNGFHEAIIDPCGLATPLPREWSIDTWLVVDDRVFFPSLSDGGNQTIETMFPCLTTRFIVDGVSLTLEHFAAPTNHAFDVLFAKAAVTNNSGKKKTGALCVAIRPFNPEGVAPVSSVEFKLPRIAHVNKSTGIVFAETPDKIFCSSLKNGDLAHLLERRTMNLFGETSTTFSQCERGLAHAVAAFMFELAPGEEKCVHYSAALEGEQPIRRRGTKQTWRVSFEKRKSDQQAKWEKELSTGAQFEFADKELQALFDASRLALLELNDNDFISPGPFLYHHFWYRDATLMIRALDVLGFHKRSRQVIDAFPARLTPDGFFRGPDGEWDSNGAVLWSVHQHFLLNRQHLWLKNWYPSLRRAALWIARKRKQSDNGLIPPSLSAEHLGTVDQYYWDTFWSLGGLKAMVRIAATLGMKADEQLFEQEVQAFEADITQSLQEVERRIGEKLIPATQHRNFDESAIGSISSIYPLELFDDRLHHLSNTLRKLETEFVDEKGFFHPFVHSGYNPYLTLQIAHSFLILGDVDKAWEVAETIFRQAIPPYSLPEAIHPRTGGGTMGDGHHGWAAAEIILFLRSCMVKEENGVISLFKGNINRLVQKGKNVKLKNVPTTFGEISCSLSFTDEASAVIYFEGNFNGESLPTAIEIYLPFSVKNAAASSPNHISAKTVDDTTSLIRCSPKVRTLFLKL
jgi:hypothetical protein